jgi:hypothetical protein
VRSIDAAAVLFDGSASVRGLKRSIEIAKEVIRIFDAGRQAQQVRRAGRAGASTEARCSMRLSTPPSDVARFHKPTRAAVAMAAASPPLTWTESM